jgi:hypothetical protein
VFEACNYDETSNADDGSCAYEYDCAGACGGDLEIDCGGVCGGDNSTADNCCGIPFNDDCTSDCYEDENTGECCPIWEVDECGVCYGDNSSCSGCTDPYAPNYDEEATVDDGSCEEYGIPLSEGDNFIVITDYINGDYGFSSIVDHDWFVGEGYLLGIAGEGVASVYNDGVWSGSLAYLELNTLYDFFMSGAAIYTYPFAVSPDCMCDCLICFGDINGDYTINVIDVVMTVNLILSDTFDWVADVNLDGQLNVIDIVMIVNWILTP